MKRTCNGCKALWMDMNIVEPVCILKHKIDTSVANCKPLEECEKPSTKKELGELMLEQQSPNWNENTDFHNDRWGQGKAPELPEGVDDWDGDKKGN